MESALREIIKAIEPVAYCVVQMSTTNAEAYPLTDLTGFQRDLLLIIDTMDRPSGQDLKTVLEQYYDNEINHGRLYPNLDSLKEKGLIDKGEIDRRTNYYDLNKRGSQEVEAYRAWVGREREE